MWPFKKKKKTPKQLPKPVGCTYIRANRGGVVDEVQTGYVRIGREEYTDMKATLVVPGQRVARDQPVGKL